jgi:hypothetical protein
MNFVNLHYLNRRLKTQYLLGWKSAMGRWALRDLQELLVKLCPCVNLGTLSPTVGCEVLAAVVMKSTVFWDITVYSVES